MKTINLKDYYPYYTQDTFVEVTDELLAVFEEFVRAESAYERKKYRYKAHYSLDRGDGIEHNILFVSLSRSMRFTNVSLQASNFTLPLLLCRTSRQSESMLIILWA